MVWGLSGPPPPPFIPLVLWCRSGIAVRPFPDFDLFVESDRGRSGPGLRHPAPSQVRFAPASVFAPVGSGVQTGKRVRHLFRSGAGCQRSRSHSRRAAGNLLTSVNGCGIIRPEKHAAERGGKGGSMRKHLSRESNMQGGIFVRYGWNCFKTGSFFRFRYPSDPCRRLPNRMAGNPCGLQDGSGCT